jgi:hypothetical protein
MIQEVEKYLRQMLDEEPVESSIIMIWSLNSQLKIDQALPILLKYLNNIISSPEEAKFRRIRTSNKVFMVSQTFSSHSQCFSGENRCNQRRIGIPKGCWIFGG